MRRFLTTFASCFARDTDLLKQRSVMLDLLMET